MRICLREPDAVRELAENNLTLSVEQHFSVFIAVALCARGWAMIQQGDSVEGIAQMRQGLSILDAGGALIGQSYWMSALLEGFLEPERASEGLRIVDQALAQSRHGLTRYYDSQLHRLKAELLMLVDPSNQSAAEGCMRRALRIAGQQGAKVQELRAAMSLSRLLHQQERTNEARSLLSPICDWFTEGPDTSDLREARALLARLR